MNLVIDIGNTRAKAALFSDGLLLAVQRWPEVKIEFIREWLTNQKVKRIILSSVGAEPPAGLESWLKEQGDYLRFGHATKTPVANAYKTPETLGLDRLAAVVGAFGRYPGQNCLVIDAGTCITFDFLKAPGIYLGGNISPGLSMRLEAMHRQTARLPLAVLEQPAEMIGTSTETALQNGAIFGAVFETEGYIRHWEQTWGNINILLTGGDAPLLAKNLKKQIFVHQNLVLEGLNKILDYNATV